MRREACLYYYEVLVYHLMAKHMVLKYPLPKGLRAAALSPDGHQLATIEEGILRLIRIP